MKLLLSLILVALSGVSSTFAGVLTDRIGMGSRGVGGKQVVSCEYDIEMNEDGLEVFTLTSNRIAGIKYSFVAPKRSLERKDFYFSESGENSFFTVTVVYNKGQVEFISYSQQNTTRWYTTDLLEHMTCDYR